MDHMAAAAEERIVTERLKHFMNQVNSAAQSQLSDVQDHVNFTLQQAYFKCAYECFDRRRNTQEIDTCVENCSVPVLQAQNLIETEMAKFQYPEASSVSARLKTVQMLPLNLPLNSYEERLNRMLMVCQDKFESAKLQQIKMDALKDMESCVESYVNDSIDTLPHLVTKLKSSLSIPN